MKICDIYSHLCAFDALSAKGNVYSEIENILSDKDILFGKNGPKEIKRLVGDKFNSKGWADNIRVGTSRLTINFLKSKVGVCFQLGNVARTYADILKLSQLGKRNIIDIGVIIVPDKFESKILGANYAQYDRLSAEVKHFQDIISMPLLIIGLSN